MLNCQRVNSIENPSIDSFPLSPQGIQLSRSGTAMFPGRAHLGTWRDDVRSKNQVVFSGKWWKNDGNMMENDRKWWKMMEHDGKWWKMDGKWWNILINRRLKEKIWRDHWWVKLRLWRFSGPTCLHDRSTLPLKPGRGLPSNFYCYYGDTAETKHDSHWMPWSVSLKKIVIMFPYGTHANIFHKFYPWIYPYEYWWTYPQFLWPHLQTAIDQLNLMTLSPWSSAWIMGWRSNIIRSYSGWSSRIVIINSIN